MFCVVKRRAAATHAETVRKNVGSSAPSTGTKMFSKCFFFFNSFSMGRWYCGRRGSGINRVKFYVSFRFGHKSPHTVLHPFVIGIPHSAILPTARARYKPLGLGTGCARVLVCASGLARNQVEVGNEMPITRSCIVFFFVHGQFISVAHAECHQRNDRSKLKSHVWLISPLWLQLIEPILLCSFNNGVHELRAGQ